MPSEIPVGYASVNPQGSSPGSAVGTCRVRLAQDPTTPADADKVADMH